MVRALSGTPKDAIESSWGSRQSLPLKPEMPVTDVSCNTACPCGQPAWRETYLLTRGGRRYTVIQIRCRTAVIKRSRGRVVETRGCPILKTEIEDHHVQN